MPCYHPLQAIYTIRSNGRKDIKFSNVQAKLFRAGVSPSYSRESLSIPCGRCMGCRLERSRQWGLRCLHESKLYDDNCFVTLTYSPENLPAGGSLVRKHVQDFMKRLRQKFSSRKIRVFYCGEYGDNLGRPHYHFCLFNLDFEDRTKWKRVNGFWYFTSDLLSSLWLFGFSVTADFSFDTAAYVARYCTKKITGSRSKDHYQGRVPEFCGMSLKPGIARGWIDKYGKSDVFPYDECVVNGMRSKPPRYYDKVLEEIDPVAFERNREKRVELAQDRAEDNSYRRLLVREKCQEARFKKLIRILET